MDREAWYAVVHGASKSQTWLSDWTEVMSDSCHTMDCSIPSFSDLHYLPSLLKLKSIELAMTSNHLILSCPLCLLSSIFPIIRVSFPMSQLSASSGQSIGASASTLVLLKNIQGWFPLGLTGLISLLSKRLSRVFSITTIWKHQFFGARPSLWCSSQYMTTGKTTFRLCRPLLAK